MKKLLLTFLALTAGFLPLAAQDWAPFRMGNTPYFQGGDSIYSLRLTNVQVVGNDSVFEFNPRVIEVGFQQQYSACLGLDWVEAVSVPDNLFGYQMRKSPSGEYRFISLVNDTFLLKTNEAVGASWVFATIDSQQVTATIQSKTAGLVQGVADSILTVSLSSGGTIKLSKKHGLVAARSFNSYLNPFGTTQVLNLVRLPEAGIGEAVNNPFRLYDFQPGDKFLHYGSTQSSVGSICTETWKTTEVLSRSDNYNPRKVVYDLRVQTKFIDNRSLDSPPQFCYGQNLGTWLSDFDTVQFEVTDSLWSHLQDLSHEFAPQPGEKYDAFFNTGMFISNFSDRIATAFRTSELDSCTWNYFTYIDGGSSFREFAEGLGEVSSGYRGSWSDSRYDLIAYIKGTETYGNWQPLVLSAEEELTVNPVQVYPNPFTSELTVKLPRPTSAEVTIYNLQGQKMRVLQTNGEANLQLPELPCGLYLLQVTQGEKSYSVKVQKQ